MHHRLALFAIAAMLVGWAPGAAAKAVTVTDGAFADSDWTVSLLQDDTFSATTEVLGWKQANGGNPGAFRGVSTTWTNDYMGSATIVAGHLRALADYDPSGKGPIGAVSFSLDARTTSTTCPTETALRIFPILEQGGTVYAAGLAAEGPLEWSEASWGPWQAAAFFAYGGDLGGPLHPDFSAKGGALRFGFAVQSGPLSDPGTLTIEGGVDNWSVEILGPSDLADAGAGGHAGAGPGEGGSGNGQVGSAGLAAPIQPMTLPPRDGGHGCGLAGQPQGLVGIGLFVGIVLLGHARRRRR